MKNHREIRTGETWSKAEYFTICPYCGYRYTNTTDIDQGEITTCDHCGEQFIVGDCV